MHCGTTASALRLILQRQATTMCSCTCRRRLSVARQRFRSILSPLQEQVLFSQYRQMSLLYFLRKVPKRFKEFKKYDANIAKRAKDSEKYSEEIAAYLWLMTLKARVRFTNGKWYSSEELGLMKQPPIAELMRYNIDAIDAKGTLIDYHGMAKLINLKEVKLLSFEGCPYIDDSCLGRLVHLKDTLTHLNINKCPEITEHGFSSLHRLSNLKRINMNDLPRVPHTKVIASMLEDVLPNLHISVVTEEVQRYRRQRDKWRPQPDQEEKATPQHEEKVN